MKDSLSVELPQVVPICDYGRFRGLPSFASGLILMLESYCDESESSVRGGTLLALAGYLADDSDWLKFNVAWRRDVLDAFGIPYFHAKDLRSGNAKLYRHLGFDQRQGLLEKACSVIGDHVCSGAIVYMRPHDWKTNTTVQQRRRWGSVYGVCVGILVTDVLNTVVGGPRRVSVFLEGGHANDAEALLGVREYKYATEPMEFPEACSPILYHDLDHPELKARETFMRIGDIALVDKVSSLPVQAADLLAYLVGSALNPQHPVFEGILDRLLDLKPHALRGFSPDDVTILVSEIETAEAEHSLRRKEIWQIRRILRSEGSIVYQLPWGIAAQHGSASEERATELKSQVDRILEKFRVFS